MIVHRLALALGACALLSFVATPRPAAADDSLTLVAGSAAPGIFDTLDLVAIGAGFFKEQHLSITKQYVAGPGPAAQLVATGKVDIGEMSVDPVLIGYERGLRLQFFLGRGSRYSYVLAVLPDSRIKSLADFKGAVLGETAPNTADVAAQSMLAGVGLKKSDYSFVTIGTGAAALTAITSKRVDGVAFPYLEVVNDDIAANTELRVFRHPILQDIVNSGYAAAPATIQSRSDVLKRFSRAIVEAALFVRANPAAAARLYLEGSGQAVTDETLDRTTRVLTLYEGDFPAADPSSRRIGLLSPGGLQLYSRYLADYGMTQTLVPGATIATDQFIPFANAFDHKKIEAFAKSMH